MVLEGIYGESSEDNGIKTLIHAIEQGMMIDTADVYGAGHNEELVSKANKQANRDAFIATKFGMVYEETQQGSEYPLGWGFPINVNGSKDYFNKCLEKSLKRLNVEAIDLMYAHFVDPNTAIEETISAMSEAVKQGKIKHIGLCNVSETQIREANQFHPITAVQNEYSLWNRGTEKIIPTLRELGIGLVCWSPLDAGFFAGEVQEIPEGDFRNNIPKFQGENFQKNLSSLNSLAEISKELEISQAQLALGWLLAQGDDIFPIPGTRKIDRIEENSKSLNVQLSDETLVKIKKLLDKKALRT